MRQKSLMALFVPVFSWCLSCVPAPVTIMPDRVNMTVPERLQALEDTVRVISTRAFCPEELQSLLLRIYQDCNLFTCKTQQVAAMVTMADPKQRFMRLMKDVPHVVIYSTREQPISPQRLIQLQWLLAPPWPDFARVLIIARSGLNENTMEVEKRGRLVRKAISDMQFARIEDFQRKSAESVGYRIPEKMLILPLHYDFPLNLALKIDSKRDNDTRRVGGREGRPRAPRRPLRFVRRQRANGVKHHEPGVPLLRQQHRGDGQVCQADQTRRHPALRDLAATSLGQVP